MTTPIDLTQISFHDSSLVGVSRSGPTITLALEDVNVSDSQSSMDVAISGADTILQDGLPIHDLQMETADGEIVQLSQESRTVTLVIRWHRYAPKSHRTAVYSLSGADLRLQAESK